MSSCISSICLEVYLALLESNMTKERTNLTFFNSFLRFYPTFFQFLNNFGINSWQISSQNGACSLKVAASETSRNRKKKKRENCKTLTNIQKESKKDIIAKKNCQKYSMDSVFKFLPFLTLQCSVTRVTMDNYKYQSNSDNLCNSTHFKQFMCTICGNQHNNRKLNCEEKRNQNCRDNKSKLWK